MQLRLPESLKAGTRNLRKALLSMSRLALAGALRGDPLTQHTEAACSTSLTRNRGSLILSQAGHDGISDIVCQWPAIGHLIGRQNALQLRNLSCIALLRLLLLRL